MNRTWCLVKCWASKGEGGAAQISEPPAGRWAESVLKLLLTSTSPDLASPPLCPHSMPCPPASRSSCLRVPLPVCIRARCPASLPAPGSRDLPDVIIGRFVHNNYMPVDTFGSLWFSKCLYIC